MKDDFDQIASEVPKGAFWITGSFMRRLISTIKKEHRFAALNGGIQEMQTKDGVALSLGLSSATSLYILRNGVLVRYKVYTSGPAVAV